MSPEGLVTIRFSDKIKVLAINQTAYSWINKTVLAVRVIEAEKEDEESTTPRNKTIVNWNVTRIVDKEIDIYVEFAEPESISADRVSTPKF